MAIDPSAYIAPTARIDPQAAIGPQTRIGEFCVIESDVVIGAHCVLEPYVFVKRWTTMGDRNEISAGTALGTDPLDKAFTGERSYLVIGNGNKVREHYTISRGTKPETVTTIGDGNYFMTSGHFAHNSIMGNNVTIASCSLISGYVEVEDQAFISGGVVVHQFSKIGRLVMVGGNCGVYEGTILKQRVVLGSGVILTRSTPVYDLVRGEVISAQDDEPLVIPEGAVVVAGSRPISHGQGKEWGISLYTPVIVKYRDARTDARVQLEDLLR